MICRLCVLVLLACMSVPAIAGTAYKCSAANGKVVYQDKPCPGVQQQEKLQLDNSAPATLPPEREVVAPGDTPPPDAPATPSVPLPAMYTCINAVDGKRYLSENGDPKPYQVLYGTLGDDSLPLYGPANGAGASTPQFDPSGLAATYMVNTYVWVKDQCHEMTHWETCHALRDAYDDNAAKLRRAFKNEQPPLEQREKQLLERLRGC